MTTFASRFDLLEAAKLSALAGEYADCLRSIDRVLRNDPNDVEALCLKGEVLELAVYAEPQARQHPRPATYDDRLLVARSCFEAALTAEPQNTRALRDLADHLKATGDRAGALACYDSLIEQLVATKLSGSEQELEEAIAERAELL